MLDEQFFGSEKISKFIHANFIPVHAVRGKDMGNKLYQLYNVRGTPTVLIADAQGNEIDRHLGYTPPPEQFLEGIKKSLKGIDTYVSLKKEYEENPDDIMTAFKLARKYDTMYQMDKSAELYKKIISNPDKAGKITDNYGPEEEEYTLYELASFLRGRALMYPAMNPDGLKEFIKEFPESKLSVDAYRYLANYYTRSKDKKEAEKFFNEIVDKFPETPSTLISYLRYFLNNDTNPEKAVEVANKIIKLEPDNFYYRQTAADVFFKKGNIEKAKQVFSDKFFKDFISGLTENNRIASYGNSYAWFWAERGENLESALEASKKSIKLNPTDYSWDTLSMIYWKMKKYEKAIEAEKKAIKLQEKPQPDYLKRIEEIKKDMKRN